MKTALEYEADIADIFATYGINLQKLMIPNINSDVCPIDFIYSPDGYTVYIEVKTRNVTKDYYDSTIIGKIKIDYFKNRKRINKQTAQDNINLFYIIFGFMTDTPDELEYYYVAYSLDRFAFYDRIFWKGNDYYKVPISDLRPIDELICKMNKIKDLKL